MAKSDTDQVFEADPLAFMRKSMVVPSDYGGTVVRNVFNHKNSDTDGGAALDSTLTVTGGVNLVGYAKLTPIQKTSSENKRNMYGMQFRTPEGATPLKGDYIAVYFLPWASNHLTKMAIPPKVPTRLNGTQTAQLQPDIFFTAAINGCSVFVTGTAKAPTVIHAGTAGQRSQFFDPNTGKPIANPFQFGNARQHWTGLFEAEMGGASYGAIHSGDYRSTAGSQTTPEAEMFRSFLTQEYRKTLRVDTVEAWGCVFGVRSATTAEWAFYLQKNVEVTMTKLKKGGVFGPKYKPVTTNLGKRNVPVKGKDGIGKRDSDNNLITKQVDNIVEETVVIGMPVQVVKFFPGERVADGASALIQPNQLKVMFDNLF